MNQGRFVSCASNVLFLYTHLFTLTASVKTCAETFYMLEIMFSSVVTCT